LEKESFLMLFAGSSYFLISYFETSKKNMLSYYSLQYNQFEGENLDFSRSTIPTVNRYEKCGVFRKSSNLQ
jgi:hypothetical protein